MFDNFKIAVVDAVDNPKSRVKVAFDGLKTDWLPLMQTANSFCKVFTPAVVGEQVLVLWNKENSTGVALRSFFNQQTPAPEGADNGMHIVEYQDGTKIDYNTENQTLTIKCTGKVKVEAEQVELGAEQLVDGVVTKQCVCAFTGAAHLEASTKVFAKKD